jgi:hypothetical protein
VTALDFEPLAEELQQLVEPKLGRDRLVTVGQLRAGGEPFQALRDLTLLASHFRIAVPGELRDRIVAAVDRLNMQDDPDIKDIKAALATVVA